MRVCGCVGGWVCGLVCGCEGVCALLYYLCMALHIYTVQK